MLLERRHCFEGFVGYERAEPFLEKQLVFTSPQGSSLVSIGHNEFRVVKRADETHLAEVLFWKVKPRKHLVQMDEESQGRVERVIVLLLLKPVGYEVG